jgi:hypothetical protein
MESAADYAWAVAVVGGPILLAVAIVAGIVRSRRPPAAARSADAPRSYPQHSDREPGGETPRS